jgi:hypothetical protein
MVDEVESDLEPVRLVDGHTTCGEPAEIQVQSHVPPVIPRRRVSKLDLADDL